MKQQPCKGEFSEDSRVILTIWATKGDGLTPILLWSSYCVFASAQQPHEALEQYGRGEAQGIVCKLNQVTQTLTTGQSQVRRQTLINQAKPSRMSSAFDCLKLAEFCAVTRSKTRTHCFPISELKLLNKPDQEVHLAMWFLLHSFFLLFWVTFSQVSSST